MERWTFLILADGPGGAPDGIRMILRSGDDEAGWPRLQARLDGTEVPVDDRVHDYEAPEWKAQQLAAEGGMPDGRWEALKNALRDRAPA
ncbi:MAG: hypothetical protein R2726_00480 [Acidimicrobiales bacterium]